MALRGKVALVTGSTQGIGYGMLNALAAAGADVVMHGLGNEKTIANRVSELRDKHSVLVERSDAELLSPAKIRDMIKGVQHDFGHLDILVNNAGIQHVSPIVDLPDEKWDAIIAVILSASFHTIKAAAPLMVDNGWGRIVNTGSMHALVASPYKSAYNAAKHGIAGLTKTVGLELAQTGVTCNSICPGYALTDLVKNQIADSAKANDIPKERVINEVMLRDQPTKEFVKIEDIGALLVHLCGPHSGCITGACLSIDGGWTAR
ncbi:hypothetical protein BSKO_11372 [Bryopsis sp. KO-2023]|nr:hypothetical protein BSKO_11372 [Bryopsis sp. KO-2023]